MAIKFQYNKTALQDLNKQLKIRKRALPTLKNKEAALRIEVKKAKSDAERLAKEFDEHKEQYNPIAQLWNEFDRSLVTIKDVRLSVKKIAGVKTPILDEVIFEEKDFSIFNEPNWYLGGIEIIKKLVSLSLEREMFVQKTKLLDYGRKKTTQKVNLYEKVQIPGYEDAIRKIKRFLEDKENLEKASQKIVKKRQSAVA